MQYWRQTVFCLYNILIIKLNRIELAKSFNILQLILVHNVYPKKNWKLFITFVFNPDTYIFYWKIDLENIFHLFAWGEQFWIICNAILDNVLL